MGRNDNVYFINYKNSVQGTGGVGSVSRDIVESHPNIHFVFWDGSEADRSNDLGIQILPQLHKTVHADWAKTYLWPILHGLPITVSSNDLLSIRKKVLYLSEIIATEIVKFSRDNSLPTQNNIYWVNDYTAITLISMLRNLDKNSTIIFTFRTPFGSKNQYPEFFEDDIQLLRTLLQADCITFHRQNDLTQFIRFITSHFPDEILKIIPGENKTIIMLRNSQMTLVAVPMGNNKDYRKNLLYHKQTKQFCKNIKNTYPVDVVITGISRFEESKGIDYEVNCIDALLSAHPELTGKFIFLRYSYISENKRKNKKYNAYRDSIVIKINEINDKYGTDGWQPIIYDFDKKLNDHEVAGLLMASDILFIASYADGFNHLALEAIYSQKGMNTIQLLLSDIGITDYIHGHRRLSHDLKVDADILYKAIESKGLKSWLRQQRLNVSANKLSSEKWIRQIIMLANTIREKK